MPRVARVVEQRDVGEAYAEQRVVAGEVARDRAVVLGLLAANTLGALTAALAKSVAEGALFSALLALLLLHWAGTFRTPVPGTWQATLEAWNPFRPLHESLLSAAGASGPDLDPALLTAPTGVTLAVLLLLTIAGRYTIGLGGR